MDEGGTGRLLSKVLATHLLNLGSSSVLRACVKSLMSVMRRHVLRRGRQADLRGC